MFISSFCSKLFIWVQVYFPSLLVPCTFSFISLFIAFIFSSNLQPNSTNSVSFLITSVLNCASDRLAISSLLSCIFFWGFDLFFHLGHFFFLGAPVTESDGALGVHRGGVMLVAALWCCTWGRGREGAMAHASLLSLIHIWRCRRLH